MNCEYVRRHYGVPAEIGRMVIVYGKPGIIVADGGHYIVVNFDQDKPGVVHPAHPTSEVQYLEIGTPRKMTKSQERYLRYLDVADCFESFRDFLRYDHRQSREVFS